MDMLTAQLGGGMLDKISGQLGADKNATSAAMTAALPMILGGLAKNAKSPEGAASLASALEKDHDGSLLDNIPGLVGMLGGGGSGGGGLGGLLGAATSMLGGGASKKSVDGAGILRHVLGDKQPTVEQGISKASGLDMSKVAMLLPMLAPIVMGAVGKMKKENNLDAGGLASMLGQEREAVAKKAPELGGIMGMLDADGDGSVVDDLMKIGGKGLLGKLFS